MSYHIPHMYSTHSTYTTLEVLDVAGLQVVEKAHVLMPTAAVFVCNYILS